MLTEAAGIKKIVIACGRTDLRKSIDGLAQLIGTRYDLNPFEKDVLFLFCGERCDQIKGLLWEGTGFLLLYKRLEAGSFSWPRTPEEAVELTREQYQLLMRKRWNHYCRGQRNYPKYVKNHAAEKRRHFILWRMV